MPMSTRNIRVNIFTKYERATAVCISLNWTDMLTIAMHAPTVPASVSRRSRVLTSHFIHERWADFCGPNLKNPKTRRQGKDAKKKRDGEEEEDANNDYCDICWDYTGVLVCCDFCDRSYHAKCLGATSDIFRDAARQRGILAYM